ncbi:MAG: hypothetical protein ACYSTX_02770 [Planctomycetota bacterium]|jgi:hypothetical protein
MKDPEKHEQNGYLDDDILEGKKDVLRAKDIIPKAAKPRLDDSSITPLVPSEDISDKEEVENSPTQKKDSNVPNFDLQEKIMTQQRKISAVRRTSPAKKHKPKEQKKPRAKSYIFDQSTLTSAEENKLISQIVTRDIIKLSREK